MLSIRTRLEERRGRARDVALKAQADELVGEHRSREAIDLLDAAVHEHSAPDLEAHLLRVRHAAFADRERTAGLPEWPPRVGEPLACADGALPEIAAGRLDADTLRRGILGHGALVVRGLLDDGWRSTLTDDIDRTFVAYDTFYDGAEPGATLPWYLPFEGPFGNVDTVRPFMRKGGGILTVESPRAARDLIDMFRAVGVIDAITGFLGETPALSVKKWTLRKVPIASSTDWHQDGAFLGDAVRTVNVWITLTDCGVDAPGLDVVPRRVDEILPTGTEGAWFDWSIGEAVVARAATEAPVQRLVLRAGDAVVFDERCVHRTAVDAAMTRERYAIESWFFAPSKYPTAQIPVML